MQVSTVAEMRAMDRSASEDYGIPAQLLMENAGLASFMAISRQMSVAGRSFLVLCGPGNNGGDGFVVARKLHAAKGHVRVLILGEPQRYQGAARLNYEIITRLGLEIKPQPETSDLRQALMDCDAVVDALLGTGLTREVSGSFREAIDGINTCGKPVFSLDIPSGINGDTGQVMGAAVRAEITVTFGLPKLGNLLLPGFDHCGRLIVTRISFPPALPVPGKLLVELNRPSALPPRNPTGHKGTFGDLLCIAGAKGYYGAPAFAALSFLKAGGGYARLAAPAGMLPHLAPLASEVVFLPQPETASGSLARSSLEALLELAQRVDMVVLGPGLSLNEETVSLVRELAGRLPRPLIIDGDGLTALATSPEVIRAREAPTVLTPHLGEMARLTGRPAAAIEQDRVAILQSSAHDLKCHIVLKGAHSLIACPNRRVCINLSGNPGMATAGAGDVLTGTIAAMYGLGLPFEEAVKKGVFMHGAAGDLAAEEKGQDGVIAGDILAALPRALHQERQGLLDKRYAIEEIL